MAGMARAMGATGAQKLLGKNLNVSLQFLQSLFCAPYIHKLQSCSNTLRQNHHVAPEPPSIMTKLWDCDITRRSAIVTEQEWSHA